MTFGERLRQSRIAKNMTQRQLADLIGVKHNSISDWENDKNKPDPDTIELLCGVLDISPNYLLNATEEAFSPFEKEIIKKYRKLDDHGKQLVDLIISTEYDRCLVIEYVTPEYQKENLTKRITAYHDNLISPRSDHIVKEGELDKTQKDLSSLKRPE